MASKALFSRAFDLLMPPRCLSCGIDVVGGQGGVCARCWSLLTFLGQPCCACCGLPFPHEPGLLPSADSRCAACLADPPPYERARSALAYDDGSRRLILGFKHGDRLDMAPLLGRWLKRAGSELLASADVVAPVPLHWTRLFRRRFNQSAVLARALVTAAGDDRRRASTRTVQLIPDLLRRRRRTPSQEGRSRIGRFRNVARAFELGRGRDVSGKRVLLVDDVMTTGATLQECTRVLLRAGAAAVDVVTLARALRY